MGQQLRLTFSDFRKLILKGFCNAGVKRASRLAKQCAVGCVLYERVLEQVARVRRHTLLEQQACLLKTLKRRSELCRIPLPDGLYYGIRKFAAKGCADLGHFSCWTQPIKSCHQRGVQTCRNGDSRRRNGSGSASNVTFGFRFQHRFRHLFNEQRDAVSALDNVLPNALGQCLVANDAVDHGVNFALPRAD